MMRILNYGELPLEEILDREIPQNAVSEVVDLSSVSEDYALYESLASDGVMDAAGSEALEALLLEGGEDMPRLAHRALAAAERGCEGGRRDDMTVVCLRLEQR